MRKSGFKRGKEESEQIAFFDYCRLKAKQDPRYDLIFHINNGGKMSIQRKMSLSRAGVRAGVPDVMIAIPKNGKAGLFLEFKVKPNKVTEYQAYWLESLKVAGYETRVVWSALEAMHALDDYLSVKYK